MADKTTRHRALRMSLIIHRKWHWGLSRKRVTPKRQIYTSAVRVNWLGSNLQNPTARAPIVLYHVHCKPQSELFRLSWNVIIIEPHPGIKISSLKTCGLWWQVGLYSGPSILRPPMWWRKCGFSKITVQRLLLTWLSPQSLVTPWPSMYMYMGISHQRGHLPHLQLWSYNRIYKSGVTDIRSDNRRLKMEGS